MIGRTKLWEDWEEQAILGHYADNGPEFVKSNYLPHKTTAAIKKRAKKLGVRMTRDARNALIRESMRNSQRPSQKKRPATPAEKKEQRRLAKISAKFLAIPTHPDLIRTRHYGQ